MSETLQIIEEPRTPRSKSPTSGAFPLVRAIQQARRLTQTKQQPSPTSAATASNLDGKKNLQTSKSMHNIVKEVRRQTKGNSGGRLDVTIVSASDLDARDSNGFSDPYVMLYCGNVVKKTRVIQKELNPTWNQDFKFMINCEKQGNVKRPLDKFRLEVWNWNFIKKDDLLGFCVLNLADLRRDTDQTVTLPLEGAMNDSTITLSCTTYGFGVSENGVAEGSDDKRKSGGNGMQVLEEEEADLTSRVSHRYERLQLIGTGGQSVVYLAKDTFKNEQVALKYRHCKSIHDASFALQEAFKLRSIQHPNLVEFKGIFLDSLEAGKFCVCFVMEYFGDGDLCNYIKRRAKTDSYFDMHTLLDYIDQMAKGVHHLHSQHYIHRDLKPHNVFGCNNFAMLKIGDFGFSEELADALSKPVAVGTLEYAPPEVVDNKPYTLSVDIWSLGVVIYEMITFKLGIIHHQLATQDVKKYRERICADIEHALGDNAYTGITELVLKMLSIDPMERCTANEILQKTSLIRQTLKLNSLKHLLRQKKPSKTTR